MQEIFNPHPLASVTTISKNRTIAKTKNVILIKVQHINQ